MSPVRRVDVDATSGRCIAPPEGRALASDNEAVNFAVLDHGEFQIKLKRCACDRLPVGIAHGNDERGLARLVHDAPRSKLKKGAPRHWSEYAFDPRAQAERRSRYTMPLALLFDI